MCITTTFTTLSQILGAQLIFTPISGSAPKDVTPIFVQNDINSAGICYIGGPGVTDPIGYVLNPGDILPMRLKNGDNLYAYPGNVGENSINVIVLAQRQLG